MREPPAYARTKGRCPGVLEGDDLGAERTGDRFVLARGCAAAGAAACSGSNPGTTGVDRQGIDIEEIISTVHARSRASMMSVTAGLQV